MLIEMGTTKLLKTKKYIKKTKQTPNKLQFHKYAC